MECAVNEACKAEFEREIFGSLRLSPSTWKAYQKAEACFQRYLRSCADECPEFGAELLSGWFIDMMASGMSFSTASYYLDSLAGIHSAEFGEDSGAKKAFSTVKRRVRECESTVYDITPAHTAAFGRIFTEGTVPGILESVRAVLRVAMFCPGMRLDDVARLKTSDLASLPAPAAEAARRYASARRSYVFPLRQSEFTPKQFSEKLSRRVEILFKYAGVPIFGSANDSVKAYWAVTMLGRGISASAVLAALGSQLPAGLGWLRLCEPAADIEWENIYDAAGSLWQPERPRWYAMRFRPGVKFAKVEGRLAELDSKDRPTVYYPCREIARRIGRKIEILSRPVIADVMFFRTTPSRVRGLFTEIGDLAWCYRTNGGYAAIPESAMHRFQQTIGILTPQTVLYPAGTIELKPSDVVQVVGGNFAGLRGVVDAVEANAEGATVCRLLLSADNGIEWRVNIDSNLLKAVDRNETV